MVSLIARSSYTDRIARSSKLAAFYNLLFGNNNENLIAVADEPSDDFYLSLISALRNNDKSTFENLYNVKSKSRPNDSTTPFVNDDFLIFTFLCGIKKFQLTEDWLASILSIRAANIHTITMLNILKGDLRSSSNIPEFVLMYLMLVNPNVIDNYFLTASYKSITSNAHSLMEGQNDFRIICALRSFDFVILKSLPNSDNSLTLESFNLAFFQRTKYVGWVVQIILLIMALWALAGLPGYSPETVLLINSYGFIFTILGAFGITFLSNQIAWLKEKIHYCAMRIFGCPKAFCNVLLKNNGRIEGKENFPLLE